MAHEPIIYIGHADRVEDLNGAMGTHWAWCGLGSHLGSIGQGTSRRYAIVLVADPTSDHYILRHVGTQRIVYFGKKTHPQADHTIVSYYPHGTVEYIGVRIEMLYKNSEEPTLEYAHKQVAGSPAWFAYYDDLMERNQRFYPQHYQKWQQEKEARKQ